MNLTRRKDFRLKSFFKKFQDFPKDNFFLIYKSYTFEISELFLASLQEETVGFSKLVDCEAAQHFKTIKGHRGKFKFKLMICVILHLQL